MQFTYKAYRDLITLLRDYNYTICDYHNYQRGRQKRDHPT